VKKKQKFVGIDLHKTQFTTCVKGAPEGENQFDQFTTDPAGYGRFLTLVSEWQAEGFKVIVGVESTGNTRYFKNRMEAAHVTVKVINTLEFKVVNKSVHKTDNYDASTIAEFLAVDMLPEAKLCSETSEKLRRLLKGRSLAVRLEVAVKNQIHGLLTGLGMTDTKASLQSKKGRQQVLNALKGTDYELVVQPFFKMIEGAAVNVKGFEQELRRLTVGDHVVELLMTIPGCGEITAWTIRAFLDDIGRFSSPKKFAAYAGLAPWVQSSNETTHIGKITKRGPKELRTALVQLVMGILRLKQKTVFWRLMTGYAMMKKHKGSGKSIVAIARKLAVIIWTMLREDKAFDESQMTDKSLVQKAASMRTASFTEGKVSKLAAVASSDRQEPVASGVTVAPIHENKQKPALPEKKSPKRLVS
jgi:transposase